MTGVQTCALPICFTFEEVIFQSKKGEREKTKRERERERERERRKERQTEGGGQ